MQGPIQVISIHALREEGDHGLGQRQSTCQQFLSTPSARRATKFAMLGDQSSMISIHALREEGDGRPWTRRRTTVIFLSTPSARRATPERRPVHGLPRDFYPRPPRGGRRSSSTSSSRHSAISIHALREEGDSKNRDKISIFKQIIQHSARI